MRSHRTIEIAVVVFVAAALVSISVPAADGAGSEVRVAAISPERAAALAVNTLEAVDGGFRLHNPHHRASFTAGGVTVSPRSGSPSWSWRLARVGPAASEVSLIGGAPVQPAKPEAGFVRYARGIFDEEYALEAGSVEQRFVLHKPPPLDGSDLVLEGVVSCDGEFSAAEGGWEWRGERGLVWLGPATVIDASGAVLPSSFEVSAGATRLVVAGTVLAGATYPVTIDPEIRGYELRISDMGDTGDPDYDAARPEVAYNSTNHQYLVVWSGDDTVGGVVDDESEIFGQRLDAATGAELGANDFRISDMGGTGDPDYDAEDPAVAYNSTNNEYLVVWHGNDNVGGLIWGEYEIFGQRLEAATGAELGANDFRISDMGGTGDPLYTGWHPGVVYNGTLNEYLIVWEGEDNAGGLVSGEWEVYVQRLDAATGAQLGYNDLRVSDAGPDGDTSYSAANPAVAYNSADDRYLVVWYGDDNVGALIEGEYEIFAELIDAATMWPLAGNDFRISDMGGTGDPDYGAQSPAVTYNSTDNEFLVVWFGDDNVGGLFNEEFEIFGQRLDAETGSTVGANDFRISDMGGTGEWDFHAYNPAVACNGTDNEYLVVWLSDDNTGGLVEWEYEIFGQRLDAATGAELGANDFRISDMGGTGDPDYDAHSPAVTYNSADNEFLVVWYGDDNTGGLVDEEHEIFGKRLGILPFEDGFESGDTSAWSTTVP